jgi:hypothetical protein
MRALFVPGRIGVVLVVEAEIIFPVRLISPEKYSKMKNHS